VTQLARPPDIRDAEPDDWRAIAHLLDRPPNDGPSLRRWAIGEYDQPLALVVEREGAVAGAVVGGTTHSTGDGDGAIARLSFVGVAPRYRRQGVGRALLEAALAELRLRQARRVSLAVEGTQVEALAFFRASGFETDAQTLGLVRPAAGSPSLLAPDAVDVRALALDDVSRLTGLLIRLGMERAEEPHDALEALTPASLETWLQRTGTVAYAAWDVDDPRTPAGVAWATRREADGLLRFIGVDEDRRRAGIGGALISSVIDAIGDRPLRTSLSAPAGEAEFFRSLSFQVERVAHRMSRALT